MIKTNLHPDWKVVDEVNLVRNFKFTNFVEALAFVNQVGQMAEELNHHPNIDIHDYNQVTLSLSTHEAKGLTAKDFSLAEIVDTI